MHLKISFAKKVTFHHLLSFYVFFLGIMEIPFISYISCWLLAGVARNGKWCVNNSPPRLYIYAFLCTSLCYFRNIYICLYACTVEQGALKKGVSLWTSQQTVTVPSSYDRWMPLKKSRWCGKRFLSWSHQIPSLDWVLTHLPLVPHICVSELGHHWFR